MDVVVATVCFVGSLTSTNPTAEDLELSCVPTEDVAGAAANVVTKGNTVDFLHPVVASSLNLDVGPAVFLMTDKLGLVCVITFTASFLIKL